jgi:hypothetical protein
MGQRQSEDGNGAAMTSGPAGRPRWILIVGREAPRPLYDLLRERLEGSEIEVVLDRRDRRPAGALGERRIAERRRDRPVAVVAAPGGAPLGGGSVPEAAAPPATEQCPRCGVTLEFDLPRFPQAPARLEMQVGHPDPRIGGHYVEIAAFTISGRLLLSQRVPARRRY